MNTQMQKMINAQNVDRFKTAIFSMSCCSTDQIIPFHVAQGLYRSTLDIPITRLKDAVSLAALSDIKLEPFSNYIREERNKMLNRYPHGPHKNPEFVEQHGFPPSYLDYMGPSRFTEMRSKPLTSQEKMICNMDPMRFQRPTIGRIYPPEDMPDGYE